MATVYLYESGILLSEEHLNFKDYNTAYNKKYGFCDDNQEYVRTLDEAEKYARQIIASGYIRERHYIIISRTQIDDYILEDFDLDEVPVEGEKYKMEDVVKSYVCYNGEIIEDFLNRNDIVLKD